MLKAHVKFSAPTSMPNIALAHVCHAQRQAKGCRDRLGRLFVHFASTTRPQCPAALKRAVQHFSTGTSRLSLHTFAINSAYQSRATAPASRPSILGSGSIPRRIGIMPKASFYAVKKGRRPGVYLTWAECEEQTKGFSGPLFKKFSTNTEAEAFIGLGSAVAGSVSTSMTSPTKTTAAKTNSSTPYDLSQRPKQPELTDESGWNVVFTDGACSGNGQIGSKAGIGVWWGDNDERNLSERCPGDQTNNRAELIAIIRCLETDSSPLEPLLIKTDSSYCISCIRDWMPTWIKRGWRSAGGAPVKNQGVIKYLAGLLDDRVGKVRFQHVRGHAGVKGNEGADRLAVAGTRLPPLPERDWTLNVHLSEQNDSGLMEGVEVDADFMLSTEELERMAIEQDFD